MTTGKQIKENQKKAAEQLTNVLNKALKAHRNKASIKGYKLKSIGRGEGTLYFILGFKEFNWEFYITIGDDEVTPIRVRGYHTDRYINPVLDALNNYASELRDLFKVSPNLRLAITIGTSFETKGYSDLLKDI